MIASYPRRAIERVPLLGDVVKSAPGQRVVQTARGARVVREPLRFAALQLRPARAADYRLRGSGLRIFLRHGTRDVNILNEIFGGTGGHNSYQPPPAVAALLAARPPRRVLDLGANIGLFGAYALCRWPAAEIHSFEPDPTNLRMLERVIAANELRARWAVTPAAVSNRAGEMSFAAGLFADSHLIDAEASDRDAITVRCTDLFAEDHDVDLIKMDIEGGEWPILADPRLVQLRADMLVLEWHARGCPEADAHTTVLQLLCAGGYTGIEEVEIGAENGLLWAWREEAFAGERGERAVRRAKVSP